MKPAKFSSGLTTHSIKCGAENEMEKRSELKDHWVQLRCGRKTTKGMVKDTKHAYCQREWAYDRPCAAILSDWSVIDGGGKCPNRSAIPSTDHEAFHQFILQLFVKIPMVPIAICDMLGCILLKWHFTIAESHPHSPVVARINELQSQETLKAWSECICEKFNSLNQVFLPLERIANNSFAEAINTQNSVISRIDDRVAYLASSQVTQERFNSELVLSIRENSETLQQLVNHVSLLTTEIRSTPYTKRARTQEQQQTVMENFSATPSALPSTSSTVVEQFPVNTISNLIGTDLASLFYSWYQDDKLQSINVAQDRQQKALLRKLSKLIIYLKHFAPTDCQVLLCRPSVNLQSNTYRDWLISLRQLSNAVKDNTMRFLAGYYQRVGNSLSTCVAKKAYIWATFKLLEKVPIDEFPVCNIADCLTKASPSICVGNEIAVFRS
jgi:hypothetical protein